MKARTRTRHIRLVLLAASVLPTAALPIGTVSAYSSAGQQYHFEGTIYSRQHGAACIGKTDTDESRLARNSDGIGTSHNTTTEIYCALQRRNLESWGHANTSPDKATPLAFNAYVKAGGSALGCRPFAVSTTGSTTFAATRYACADIGGCLVSAAYTGAATLTWPTPFGQPYTPANVQAVNMGLYCTFTGSGSYIYAYDSVFQPNSEH